MIHPEDYRLILAMLSVQDVPAGMEDEYAMRLSMFHRAGNQGPMGAIGLIGMIRDLGHKPVAAANAPARIDWSKYPVNGRIRTEVRGADGTWFLGVYNGMSGPGELAIKLDGDPYVRTFLARDVRLALDQTPPRDETTNTDNVSVNDPPLPPAAETVIDSPGSEADESDDDGDDELMGNDDPTDFIPPPKKRTQSKRKPQIVCDEPDPPEENRHDVGKSEVFDWSAVTTGTDVWVQDENDGLLEGKLIALAGDKLSLLIDGETEPRDFDSEICTLAG